MRWTESELEAARNRLSAVNHPARGKKPKSSKFGNHPTYVDGIRFASKREARYYEQLKLLKFSGEIRGFTHQVSLPLPSGKRRMIIDFMVINMDSSIRWIDAKGHPDPQWSVKKDELEFSLGITIETV